MSHTPPTNPNESNPVAAKPSKAKTVVAFAIVLGLLGLVVFGVSLLIPGDRLIVFNGLPNAVVVTINGETKTCPSSEHTDFGVTDEIRTGPIKITLATEAGDVIETRTESWTADHNVHVYNPLGAGLLALDKVKYGIGVDFGTEDVYDDPWRAFAKIDYIFTNAPDEVEADVDENSVTKLELTGHMRKDGMRSFRQVVATLQDPTAEHLAVIRAMYAEGGNSDAAYISEMNGATRLADKVRVAKEYGDQTVPNAERHAMLLQIEPAQAEALENDYDRAKAAGETVIFDVMDLAAWFVRQPEANRAALLEIGPVSAMQVVRSVRGTTRNAEPQLSPTAIRTLLAVTSEMDRTSAFSTFRAVQTFKDQPEVREAMLELPAPLVSRLLSCRLGTPFYFAHLADLSPSEIEATLDHWLTTGQPDTMRWQFARSTVVTSDVTRWNIASDEQVTDAIQAGPAVCQMFEYANEADRRAILSMQAQWPAWDRVIAMPTSQPIGLYQLRQWTDAVATYVNQRLDAAADGSADAEAAQAEVLTLVTKPARADLYVQLDAEKRALLLPKMDEYYGDGQLETAVEYGPALLEMLLADRETMRRFIEVPADLRGEVDQALTAGSLSVEDLEGAMEEVVPANRADAIRGLLN